MAQGPGGNMGVWEGWQAKVEAFQNLTGATFDPSQPALDLARLVADIDAENARLSTAAAGKWAKLRKYLGWVVRPIEGLGEVAVRAIGVIFPPAAGPAQVVLLGLKYLIKSGEAVEAIYQAITCVLQEVHHFSTRLEAYMYANDLSPEMQVIVAETFSTYLEIITASIDYINRGRVRHFISFTLLGSDSKIPGLIKHLQDLMNIEDQRRDVDAYIALRDIHRDLKNLGKEMQDLLISWRIQDQTKWFPSQNLYRSAKNDVDLLMPTSGFWLQQQEAYRRWSAQAADTPLLWINATPRTGRKYTVVHIVNDISAIYPQYDHQTRHPVSVAYFMFDPAESALQSIETALRTLAGQLVWTDAAYAKYVRGLNRDVSHMSVSEAWKFLFEGYFGPSTCESSAYLVLYCPFVSRDSDPDSEAALPLFLELATSSSGFVNTTAKKCRLSICIIDEPRFGTILQNFNHKTFTISADTNKPDLDSYIDNSLFYSGQYPRLRRNFEYLDKIRVYLKTNAKGSFFWVKIMLDILAQADGSKKRWDRFLTNSPKAGEGNDAIISSLFNAVVASVTSEKKYVSEILKNQLLWVLAAPSPLSVAALQQSFKIESDEIGGLLEGIRYDYGKLFRLTTREGVDINLDSDLAQMGELSDSPDSLYPPGVTQPPPKWQPNEHNIFVRIRYPFISDFIFGPASTSFPELYLSKPAAYSSVFRSCLEIFTDLDKFEIAEHGLARVASRFHEMLPKFMTSNPSSSQKTAVATVIQKFFGDGNAISRWLRFSVPFLTKEVLYSESFWSCLAGLTPDGSLLKEKDAIRERVARQCGQRWLAGHTLGFESDVLFLYSFLSKTESVDHSQVVHEELIRNLGVEDIEKIARWVGLDERETEDIKASGDVAKIQTAAIQASGLSSALLCIGEVGEAIRFGERSVALNDEDGDALAVLASAYLANKEHERAESALLASLMPGMKWSYPGARVRAQATFLRVQESREDVAEQFDSSLDELRREINGLERWGTGRASSWLDERKQQFLLRRGEYDKVTGMIECILSTPLNSIVQEWLLYFWDLSLHASHHTMLAVYAQKTGRTDRVSELYSLGSRVLSVEQIDGGRMLFDYYDARMNLQVAPRGSDRIAARNRFDAAARRLMRGSVHQWYKHLQRMAPLEAETAYLMDCRRNLNPADQAFQDHLNRIFKAIGKWKDHPEERPDVLALAVWQRLYGQLAESRQIAQPLIQQAIRMIGRPTRPTREYGFHLLGWALSAAGEEEDARNALACIKLVHWGQTVSALVPESDRTLGDRPDELRSISRQRDQLTAGADIFRIVSGHFSGFLCDSCGRFILSEEYHWHCTVCITVDLCRHCYRLLKSGKPILNLCDESHVLWLIPPALERGGESEEQYKVWWDTLKTNWGGNREDLGVGDMS